MIRVITATVGWSYLEDLIKQSICFWQISQKAQKLNAQSLKRWMSSKLGSNTGREMALQVQPWPERSRAGATSPAILATKGWWP